MTSLLNLHVLAAARGDGLRPELRALFERIAAAPRSELTARNDGMIQSGPNPISADVTKERANISLFPQPSTRQTDETIQNPRSGAFVFVGNDIRQCRNVDGKATAGANQNLCGMHLNL